MKLTPTVSAVVPAYNCQLTIAFTIKALKNQDYSIPIEIIVIDDGSTDQTAEVVKSFPEVKYFKQPNSGPASARNLGFQKSTGQYVFFTDSDCIPREDCVRRLIEGFIGAKIGVVCGSYDIANPKSLLAFCIHQEIMYRHKYLLPAYPKAFGSYNFCIRRDVFQLAGGFNTQYRNASGEDNDLSYKILKKGFSIYFERQALVKHFHTTSLKKYLKEQYRHGFWRIKMYQDHPGMMRGDDYTFWKDIVEVPLAFIAAVGGISFFVTKPYFTIFIYILLLFMALEIGFGILFLKKLIIGSWFGIIMLLRAEARMFGFSSGFLELFRKKMGKI